jgi:hypothetical protein
MSEVPVRYVYAASIRLRNGRRIFASSYGKRAFRIAIRDEADRPKPV